jgi:hypothetical protein
VEVREADDITGGRVQFVFVARDNPLRLCDIYH